MTRYRFDEHTFDTAGLELWKGEESMAIRHRTAELLAFFLENRGRLLTKDEILDEVWRDSVVGDAVLFQTISDLRRVLGETPQQPRCIESLKKRGYRWIYEPTIIETAEDPGSLEDSELEEDLGENVRANLGAGLEANPESHSGPSRRSHRFLIHAGTTVFAVAIMVTVLILGIGQLRSPDSQPQDGNLRLALLPFENVSGIPENAWAEFGLRAVVGTLLESVEGLEVESLDIPASIDSAAPRAELEALAVALDVDAVIATRFQVVAVTKTGSGPTSRGSSRATENKLYRLDAEILSPGSQPRGVQVEGHDLTDCAERLARSLAEQTQRPSAPESAESLLSKNAEAIRAYGMGRQSLDMGEPEAARLFFEKALHLDETMTWARIDLARSLEELGEVELGEKETWTALGEAEQRRDARQKDACLANLARIATRKGELDQAVGFRRRVLESAESRDDSRQVAQAMVELAEALRQQGDLDQAMNMLVAARRSIESDRRRLGVADCERRMGGVEYLRRRPAAAQQHFNAALEVYRQLGHRWRETEVLSSLGLVAAELGEVEESEDLHREALNTARHLGNPRALTHALNNLGVSAFHQGRFKEARDFYLEALDVATAAGRQANRISISFNLAEVYLELDDRHNGRPHLERCQDYFARQEGHHLALSINRVDLQDLATRYDASLD